MNCGDSYKLTRKLAFISLSLVLTFILVSSGVTAHPPSDIELDYNGADGVLNVQVNHRVGNPSNHYVEKITVYKNGNVILEKAYQKQDSSSGGNYSYRVKAQNGDSIRVEAKCNQFGNVSGTLEVQGVPVQEKVLLHGSLTTDSAVPAVVNSTPDTASGLVIAILDRANNVLQYSLTYKGLSDVPTMAHFHRGVKGETGPPVRTIFGKPVIEAAPKNPPAGDSAFITGNWTDKGKQPLTEELEAAILSGNIYVNIHTELNKGGEIRAQLVEMN